LKEDEVLVLVVDDAPDVADALAALLNIDGYATVVANDAQSALGVCDECLPHCVLLDIEMPGMNGLELSRRLRDSFGSNLVLIAVTGRGQQDERVSAKFECFDYYLRKPVTPEQLRAVLPPLNP
jgi:CheY-like chemotaxis protein